MKIALNYQSAAMALREKFEERWLELAGRNWEFRELKVSSNRSVKVRWVCDGETGTMHVWSIHLLAAHSTDPIVIQLCEELGIGEIVDIAPGRRYRVIMSDPDYDEYAVEYEDELGWETAT